MCKLVWNIVVDTINKKNQRCNPCNHKKNRKIQTHQTSKYILFLCFMCFASLLENHLFSTCFEFNNILLVFRSLFFLCLHASLNFYVLRNMHLVVLTICIYDFMCFTLHRYGWPNNLHLWSMKKQFSDLCQRPNRLKCIKLLTWKYVVGSKRESGKNWNNYWLLGCNQLKVCKKIIILWHEMFVHDCLNMYES